MFRIRLTVHCSPLEPSQRLRSAQLTHRTLIPLLRSAWTRAPVQQVRDFFFPKNSTRLGSIKSGSWLSRRTNEEPDTAFFSPCACRPFVPRKELFDMGDISQREMGDPRLQRIHLR